MSPMQEKDSYQAFPPNLLLAQPLRQPHIPLWEIIPRLSIGHPAKRGGPRGVALLLRAVSLSTGTSDPNNHNGKGGVFLWDMLPFGPSPGTAEPWTSAAVAFLRVQWLFWLLEQDEGRCNHLPSYRHVPPGRGALEQGAQLHLPLSTRRKGPRPIDGKGKGVGWSFKLFSFYSCSQVCRCCKATRAHFLILLMLFIAHTKTLYSSVSLF